LEEIYSSSTFDFETADSNEARDLKEIYSCSTLDFEATDSCL
jgi:hypothetical protein